jgi:hypothetical protein
MSNSGKYLEDAFQGAFDKKNPELWFHRFADSKAARNLIGEQPADFLVATVRGGAFLLECKSVKHLYRLPKFAQHSRMNRAKMSGVPGKLLVHHYMEDFYRVVDVEEISIGPASFDLREWPKLDWDQALEEIFKT